MHPYQCRRRETDEDEKTAEGKALFDVHCCAWNGGWLLHYLRLHTHEDKRRDVRRKARTIPSKKDRERDPRTWFAWGVAHTRSRWRDYGLCGGCCAVAERKSFGERAVLSRLCSEKKNQKRRTDRGVSFGAHFQKIWGTARR